jgi:hypothetical protein
MMRRVTSLPFIYDDDDYFEKAQTNPSIFT